VCCVCARSLSAARWHLRKLHLTILLATSLQVLQLVCKACGKPCRSETEKQLHTTRNPGHTEFVDQTSAGAGPVDYTLKKDGASWACNVRENYSANFLRGLALSSLLPARALLRQSCDLGCSHLADPMDLDDETRAAIAAATGKDPASVAKAAAAKGEASRPTPLSVWAFCSMPYPAPTPPAPRTVCLASPGDQHAEALAMP